jgi:hypothetical protein
MEVKYELGSGAHGSVVAVGAVSEIVALKRLPLLGHPAVALINAVKRREALSAMYSPWVATPSTIWFDYGMLQVRVGLGHACVSLASLAVASCSDLPFPKFMMTALLGGSFRVFEPFLAFSGRGEFFQADSVAWRDPESPRDDRIGVRCIGVLGP